MANFVVNVDHLNDQQMSFFGWLNVDQGEEFSVYWNPRYNEFQVVSNDPPRYLIIDDWNDAKFMSLGGDKPIREGPSRLS